MNKNISVVIICNNEAHIIGRTLAAASKVSDDIIVVDSGSTDGTQQIAEAAGATVIATHWDGYGPNKNKGVERAARDWILSVDADEIIDDTLAHELCALELADANIVYNLRFRVFFGDRMIRFGEWAKDEHIRLYNRTKVHWNAAQVHESLEMPASCQVHTLKGFIRHYTSRNLEELAAKTLHYAMLNAARYHRLGKRAGWLRCRMSGPYSFFVNYLLRLGFLDGEAGYTIARMNAWYTWLKYTQLRLLNRQKQS